MLHETTAYFETIDLAELAVRRLRETNAKISKILLQAEHVDVPKDYDWQAVQEVSYPIYVSALGFGSSPFTTNIYSPVPPSLFSGLPEEYCRENNQRKTAVMHVFADSKYDSTIDNCLRNHGAFHIVH